MTAAGHDVIIAHLAAGDTSAAGPLIAEELRGAGLAAADVARFSELIEGVWWSSQAEAAGLDATLRTVVRAVECARQVGAETLVLGYIRSVCEAAWELSWDHRPLLAVIGAAIAAAKRSREEQSADTRDDDGSADEATDGAARAAAVSSLALLEHELRVESASSTGSLASVEKTAREAERHAASALRLAHSLEPGPLRDALVTTAQSRHDHLAAIGRAAKAARPYLLGSKNNLDSAIDALAAVENDPDTSSEAASELRSQRAALRGMVAAAERDWLRVDDGTVTHVFPFGLRHVDHAEIVAAVKHSGEEWSLAGRQLGNAPSSLLLVDDIWRGEDPLKRRYEGTQLDLPSLVTSIDGRETTLRVAIVISQIGNHHVRVELDLADVLPHELAEASLLAAPEYGDLHELGRPLRFAAEAGAEPVEEPGWPRLVDFITQCLHDLVDNLGTGGLTTQLSFRPGMFHVVTEVRRASALPGGDALRARVLDDASELPELFGASVVCGAIPSGTGSIADWAIDGTPRGVVVPTAIATGTLLQLSANQSLIASFSAPSFMLGGLRQAIEFVVSLEGMFAAWQDELSDFQTNFAPYLAKFAQAGETLVEAAEVEADVAALEQQHVRLRRFVTSARISLLFIDSPALVSSPVVRQTISELLAHSPVWARRTDFTDSAGEALSERFEELIEGWGRRRAERREARNRVLVETLLAVVAGIGISGVASIVQAGFDMKGWLAFLLIVAVLLAALLIGVFAYLWMRDPGRLRNTHARARRRDAGHER